MHDKTRLPAMALDLAKNAIVHAADGFRHAPPEVQAERKAICLACDYADDNGKQCRVCGCGSMSMFSMIGVDLALKRTMASSRCPLNPPKWEAEQ